jgi:hypothetical protein
MYHFIGKPNRNNEQTPCHTLILPHVKCAFLFYSFKILEKVNIWPKVKLWPKKSTFCKMSIKYFFFIICIFLIIIVFYSKLKKKCYNLIFTYLWAKTPKTIKIPKTKKIPKVSTHFHLTPSLEYSTTLHLITKIKDSCATKNHENITNLISLFYPFLVTTLPTFKT